MWMLYAVGSALFAGLMTVLSKIGIKNTDSETVTTVRTFFVLIFCCITVSVTDSYVSLNNLPVIPFAFLFLSGIATALSWLCYFKALSNGNVNGVAAIDKTATVIAVIAGIFLFNETNRQVSKLVGVFVILTGILYLSLGEIRSKNKSWVGFAFASAAFSGLSAVLSKVGVNVINSNMATTVRTAIVLLISFFIVFSKGKIKQIYRIPIKDMLFIFLSSVATTAGWLCFYKALSIGETSLVVPIDKLSLLFTAVLSAVILKQTPTKKEWLGICTITVGTLIMTINFS